VKVTHVLEMALAATLTVSFLFLFN
jgi:hypothetical protein